MISKPPRTVWLIMLGLIASFFFSSTFVLNRWMIDDGGHWFWTASLRYGYVLGLGAIYILARGGMLMLRSAVRCVVQHRRFWVLAGGIGFGAFYLLLCFAASFAPGWVVATTWQVTILGSLAMLWLLGAQLSVRGIVFITLVFMGVLAVNLEQSQSGDLGIDAAWGVVAIVVAGLCYPFGNNLLKWSSPEEASPPNFITTIHADAMADRVAQIWMMAWGAMPVLASCGLAVFVRDGFVPPTPGQLTSTLYVALSTGLVATGIFLYARSRARTSVQLATVDATQAGEVPFALFIEVLLFQGKLPGAVGFLGLVLFLMGFVGLALRGHDAAQQFRSTFLNRFVTKVLRPASRGPQQPAEKSSSSADHRC